MKRRLITTLLASAMTASLAMPAMATQEEGLDPTMEAETAAATQEAGVATQSLANGQPEVMGYAALSQSTYTPTPQTTPSVSATNNTVTGVNGSMDTVLNGEIVATKLEVTVPTAVFFLLDPTYQDKVGLNSLLTQAAYPGGLYPGVDASTGNAAVGSPTDGIYITNRSVVPVYGKITEVKVQQGQNNYDTSTPVTLVNNLTDVKKEKCMMFAFKTEDALEPASPDPSDPTSTAYLDKPWSNPYDWLMECADQEQWKANASDPADPNRTAYLLTKAADKGRIAGLTYEKDETTGAYKVDQNGDLIEKVSRLKMKIYARTQTGWHVGDTFTITPTIVISVLEYGTASTTPSNPAPSMVSLTEEEQVVEGTTESQFQAESEETAQLPESETVLLPDSGEQAD